MATTDESKTYVVAIDIGGTGADCVVVDAAGEVTLGKAFSTPPEFATGILNAVAENAVVDETLATGGILVSEGCEDTLFSMRGGYGRWSGLTEEGKRNP